MVWQEYDGAAATVAQEASAVADLYHIRRIPPRIGVAESALGAESVRQRGDRSRVAGDALRARKPSGPLHRLSRAHDRCPVSTAQLGRTGAPAKRARFATAFIDARRDRLFANQQGIPVFFWIGNIILASITIGFCFMFRVRREGAHLIMTLALTTVIATIFVLIALFDYPFRGDTQIPPSIFIQLRHSLAGEPIVSGLPIAPARSQSSSAR